MLCLLMLPQLRRQFKIQLPYNYIKIYPYYQGDALLDMWLSSWSHTQVTEE